MDDLVLTMDVEWAPDFAIDFVADHLMARRVRATWFVTHGSPAIERLRRYPDLFELGIHPNFLPGSSHGETPGKVLDHCIALVPEATSVRTHALVQSTPLLAEIMAHTAITTDVSLFLPHTLYQRPFEYRWKGRTLLRVPYFWEDDFEMERDTPIWHLAPLVTNGEGLKVFNFHPIHVYLNSSDMGPYESLKRRISNLSEATVAALVQPGEGTRTLFLELVDYLAANGHRLCMRDIYRYRH
jgi:hypothetical protein